MPIFLSSIFYLLFLFILVLSICFSFFLVLSKKARHQANMSGSDHIRLEHGLRLIRLNFKEVRASSPWALIEAVGALGKERSQLCAWMGLSAPMHAP